MVVKEKRNRRMLGKSGRVVVCLGLIVCLLSCYTGCSIIDDLLNGGKGNEGDSIPAEINLARASSDGCFSWSGDVILGLTETGKQETNIVIPQKASEIKDAAFAGATLKSVGFQNPDIILGEGMFDNCIALEKVQLPDNIKGIPATLFKECRSLQEIILPDQVKSIGDMAFYQCVSLEKVTHGGKLESIGHHAFHTCDKLREFQFPPTLVSIGEGAFGWCYSLESVVLTGGNLEVLNRTIFTNCDKLASVVIPEGVKKMEIGVFAQCPNLVDIKLPESLTEIHEAAFKNTVALGAKSKVFRVKKDSYADASFNSYAITGDVKQYY